MLRFTFFGPFVIGCAAVAFAGVFSSNAYAQPGSPDYGDEMQGPGGMGGPGRAAGITDEQRFQRGIRRVVKSLEQAETEEEKERLLELGRKGLEWRYQSKLDARKQQLDKLRQRLEQLEDDYARRTQAMPRVINLQLESLKLASEGLINLEDVIGRQTSMGMGGYGGEMGGGYGMGGGYEDGGYGGAMGDYGMAGYGGMPAASQPIKPDEDPFEGLGDEKKKKSESDDAAGREETPVPSSLGEEDLFGEPPSNTNADDLFGEPTPDPSESNSEVRR